MKSDQKLKNYGRLPEGKRFKKLFDQKGDSAPWKMAKKFVTKNGLRPSETLYLCKKKMVSKNNDFRNKNMKNT